MNRFTISPGGPLPWTGERMVPGVEGDSKLEHLHRYAIAVDLAVNKDVLDIACGEGYGSMLLAGTARSVLGVDNSVEIIDHARQRYKARNLKFEAGLCQEIPLPDASVDLVVSFETIQHILEQEAFLREVRRVLRPGGRLLLSCPNKALDQVDRDNEKLFYLHEFSFQELQKLVQGFFSHHFWLMQRVCYGSIIYGLEETASSQLHSYDGDFQQINSRKDLAQAPSFLVLCSDAPLEILPNSVFENPSDLGRLRDQATALERPLLNHLKNLELRISRMECSVWWRLRKPLKFLSDLIHGRPATGMFTQPKAKPAKTRLPRENSDPAKISHSWTNGNGTHAEIPAIRDVTVVVPAYNNFEELQFCMASILRFTSAKHRILIVDDCSTDVRVWPMLQKLASQYSQITLHRNTVNLGYTATLNHAIELCGETDVAVVNSDVRVSKKWLHKLAHCAGKHPSVATVSPLINRPGPFEIPFKTQDGYLPSFFSIMDIAETVEGCSGKIIPRVPSTNHACLYIRREALEKIGGFDEKNFPHGFGENLDFAARASEAGFIHLIDDSTFVFQPPTPSLKERRQLLSTLGQQKVASLHPQIVAQIEDWMQNDPLEKLRNTTQVAITLRSKRLTKIYRKETRRKRKGTILYIVQEGSGGTVLTSEDLIKNVSDTHVSYLLRTSFQRWSFYLCEGAEFHLLQRFSFTSPWTVDSELDQERREALDELLNQFKFGVVHIRHLLGSGPEIITRIKEHDIPVVFSFHDFYTVCPNIQLLDNNKTFCAGHCTHPLPNGAKPGNGNYPSTSGGGTTDTSCADCNVPTIWPLVTLAQPLKHKYVYEWRKRTRQALEKCDGFVTTSKFSTQILLQHFEFLRKKDFRTIEHGRDFSNFRFVGTPPNGSKIRIIYFGSLQVSKGAELLAQIMRLDRAGKKRFEFHLLGSIARNGFDPRRLGAKYHGRYTREQLVDLVAEIKPSFAIIPSIWPETFCHTLTEAWALGLPVFASDIGTLSERVQGQGGGWLMDPQSPQAWYEKMLAVSNDPAEYEAKLQAIRQHPLKTIRQMAEEYIDLYDHLIENQATLAA